MVSRGVSWEESRGVSWEESRGVSWEESWGMSRDVGESSTSCRVSIEMAL